MQKREGPFAGSPAHIADGYRRGIHQIVKSLWVWKYRPLRPSVSPAIGLGNDVACLCDMRIASEQAIFGATFLKVGLIPGDGGAWLLPRIIGGARASELLFTGKTISADEALGWGLVSQVVADDKLLETAHDMAHEIAAQSAEALRAAKRLLRHGQNSDFASVMEMSANAQALMHMSEDHSEAVAAMLEKRPADYKDK